MGKASYTSFLGISRVLIINLPQAVLKKIFPVAKETSTFWVTGFTESLQEATLLFMLKPPYGLGLDFSPKGSIETL